MSIQLDMFPAPARRIGGGPPSVHLMWERAMSPAVREEILAAAGARKGEWLEWNDFRPIIKKYNIGSKFGHVLSLLVHEGLLGNRKIFFGSESGPGYQGFKYEWRAA